MTISYADKLRRFADWLEAHPAIADEVSGTYDYPAIYIHSDSVEHFGKLCGRAGQGTKDSYQGTLTYVVRKDDEELGVVFRVSIQSPANVCEAIPTGEKRRVPVYVPDDAVMGDDGKLYREIPEVEYKCPESFLALAGEGE